MASRRRLGGLSRALGRRRAAARRPPLPPLGFGSASRAFGTGSEPNRERPEPPGRHGHPGASSPAASSRPGLRIRPCAAPRVANLRRHVPASRCSDRIVVFSSLAPFLPFAALRRRLASSWGGPAPRDGHGAALPAPAPGRRRHPASPPPPPPPPSPRPPPPGPAPALATRPRGAPPGPDPAPAAPRRPPALPRRLRPPVASGGRPHVREGQSG